MQLENQYDTSNCVPLNDWHPRRVTPTVDNHLNMHPKYDLLKDPTRAEKGLRSNERIVPPKNYDLHQWLMDRLNLRMALLGCAPRDPETCIGYIGKPEDELHHVLGFYGDWERIETYYNYKHYMIDIYNKDGIDAFRYVVVENTNHWPPVTLGEPVWDFFRQFRRDSETGKIIEDRYQACAVGFC